MKRGLLGSIAFDSEGDMTQAPVTVFRALRGGGSRLVTSTDGAEPVRDHQRSVRAPEVTRQRAVAIAALVRESAKPCPEPCPRLCI